MKETKINTFDGIGTKNDNNQSLDFPNTISEIPQHVFEILYRVTDTPKAIDSILKMLGEVNQVSRVYIFEDTDDHKFCSNTFEWCAKGIQPEIRNLGYISYNDDLGGTYQNNFDEQGIFFCPDVSFLPAAQYRILAKQGIFSMLQSAILENGEWKGYIGFDECSGKREWTEQQKQCLFLTSKIISTFLCKMRREEALKESNYKLLQSLEQLKYEHAQLKTSEQRFQLIMENTSVSVWEYDVKNKEIIQMDASQKKNGLNKIISNVPESLIDCGYIHPDSVNDFRKMYQQLANGEKYTHGVFRVQTIDRTGWWYEKIQYTNLLDENGKPYKAIGISSDISITKAEEEKMRMIIDNVPGGIGIFEMSDNQIHIRYLNKGFYNLVDDTRVNREKYTGDDFWKAIHPDDLNRVRNVVSKLENENHIDFKYRVINGHDSYTWLRVVGDKHNFQGNALIYCTFVNVDKYMQALLELQKNQALLDIAMMDAKIGTWEFDVCSHSAILNEAAQKQHGLEKVVENLPESMIQRGFIHPDSIENYRQLFSGIFPDKNTIQYDIRVKLPNQSGFWWERCIMSPFYDSDGALITAFGTSIDITEQKRLQERFQKQISDLEQIDGEHLIVKACYNLSKNTIEYYYRKTEAAIECEKIRNYNSGFFEAIALMVDEDEQNQFIQLFNREKLLREFSPENSLISLEHHRKSYDNHIFYALTQAKLFSDPSTGNIMCFISVYDITEQKTTQEMIDAVVRLDYDYISLLDCQTHNYIVYANKEADGAKLPPFHSSNYEKEVEQYAHECLIPEDVNGHIHDMSIGNIRVQLKDNDRFSCYANIKNEDGSIRRKMIQFSYLDKIREKVLITRIDVTDVYRKEQQKIEELQAAKDNAEKLKLQAENANQIKTKFFTQMSHDLRTPLNAVIGLTELAKDELSDPDEMKKYIDSIQLSGNFLLSLVNDGLDLEKLAANKMVLNPVPYTYTNFKNSICTIIEPLCHKKNITLVLGENTNPYTVFIDKIRFEQIFINLLTNAVKFTPSGGKVEFLIAEKHVYNDVLSCQFIVRDTGIGMSEEFQQRMFEPFEQEKGNLASQSQGTGLGLSIVKSLVDILGGTISVKSHEGLGTEFTIHMDIPVVRNKESDSLIPSISEDYSFLIGKHILLVEDHPLNTQIAKRLLEKKGMLVDCAVNGKDGLEKFISSKIGCYDAILMDINMPIMNGLEATESIRSLLRSDSKTIPIIAMSANTFKDDIKKCMEVGMSTHLPKPFDPKKLYSMLEQYIQKCII